jgi:hypothetical protein
MGDTGRAAPSIKELRRRLELALKPVERPPAPDEVLGQVSRRGVLRGPVDWAFPAWIAYVEYAVQKIIETFPLTEEEKKQLIHFRGALVRLLREAWRQAKERLASIYKAVVEGTCRIEGKRLYAPDGTWMYINERVTPRIPIHGASAETYFPDVLKLPRERLELLQLGWRASDEFEEEGWPVMSTSQPWQLPAWAAARHGELHVRIGGVNLTREGASIAVYLKATGWRQKWNKDEAVDLVVENLRHGEWALLLTMWLGDGIINWKKVLRGKYELVIATKEPWRLGLAISARCALIAAGKEAFKKLRDAAGIYGTLLDLLGAHKWVAVKLATDDALKTAYKLRTKKRNIDALREAHGQSGAEASAEWPSYDRQRKDAKNAIVIAGIKMLLHLISNKGGSLRAEYYANSVREALAIASRLEAAGLGPNVAKSGHYYVVYIATADLLWLAEKDVEIRRSIAHYLAEKARSGTPRQREIARKLMQRHSSLFSPSGMAQWFSQLLGVGAILGLMSHPKRAVERPRGS